MKKKILCVLLSLCMALTLSPAQALADTAMTFRQESFQETVYNALYDHGELPKEVEVGEEVEELSRQNAPAEEPDGFTAATLLNTGYDDDATIAATLQTALDGTADTLTVYYKSETEIVATSASDKSPIRSFADGLGFASLRETAGVEEAWAVKDVYKRTVDDTDGWYHYRFDYVRARYISNLDSAVEDMRANLVSRTEKPMIFLKLTQTISPGSDLIRPAMGHTGVPDEGDYLLWQWEKYGMVGSLYQVGSNYYYNLTVSMTYYTTAEQEQEVDDFVDTFMARDDMQAARTDYEKVKVIYDWLCANIVYDHAHVSDTSYKPQFTAYAAAISHVCVCQGYALLFYRLALTCGIDARLIAGYAGNSVSNGHAWNAVKIEDCYYLLDATWDAGAQPEEPEDYSPENYDYFLCGKSFFPNHTRYPDSSYIKNQYDPTTAYDVLGVSLRDYGMGDLDGDGDIDAVDMEALFEYLYAGSISLHYAGKAAKYARQCDYNSDGTVNILDYQALYMLLLAEESAA